MNIQDLLKWIETHQSILYTTGLFSLIMVFCAAAAVPFIINMLSSEYFIKEKRRSNINSGSRLVLFVFTIFLKNFIGYLLLLSGIIMLFVPGQGLITIFISLLFIDFPGKWRLQKRIVKIKKINSALNWIRRKGNRSEFIIPE